jgi:hypothetical protein
VAPSLLIAACAAQQKSTLELLPQPAHYDAAALDQKPPAVRYADFERQYREGAHQEPYWPLEDKYEGIGQLVMPPSVRPEAAWAYISLGKDFRTNGDLGGAAVSYWAALELVTQTVASRPDRERVMRAAFEGLEAVAEARGQKKWGKLMRFCAHLAQTYLDSPQAQADNARFYAHMETIKTAEQEIELARAQANSQLMNGLLNAAVAGVGVAGAMMAHNSFAVQQYTEQGVSTFMEAKTNYNNVTAAIKELAEKSNEQYKALRLAVASDVEAEEIGALRSFLAAEVLFYIDNATAPGPYLQLLSRFARNKPRLNALLTSYGDLSKTSLTPEMQTKVLEELEEIQKFVIQYERRGKVPAFEVAQAVWP